MAAGLVYLVYVNGTVLGTKDIAVNMQTVLLSWSSFSGGKEMIND